MHKTVRKINTIETKDDTAKKKTEEKLNVTSKVTSTTSTPRNFVKKTLTSDIYAQRNSAAKAPNKSGSSNIRNVTPMKDFLKSSSSISVASSRSVNDKQNKITPRISERKFDPKTPLKAMPPSNVTVNSPIVKRKLNLDKDSEKLHIKGFKHERAGKEKVTKIDKKETIQTKVKEIDIDIGRKEELQSETQEIERKRTKTRTLDEEEVKILTHEVVDNNAEMMSLTKKLAAQPKSFYVNLDDDNLKKKEKSSDEDYSYEDDFESYESDFDSYHSEKSEQIELSSEQYGCSSDQQERSSESEQDIAKEGKDEEKKMDSGNFHLREQHSATGCTHMGDIMEASEELEPKPMSLTDEGFQEMSSCSAQSSMKTDILDRPLFIDFTKSKENKRKRQLNEQLKRRAKDLLGMITLHEMSYALFEMKPIPYDLFMATFGRSNYIQNSVQTFDDGLSVEVQTEKILYDSKWTQFPVKFSKKIYLDKENSKRNSLESEEAYLKRFTFLQFETPDVSLNNTMNVDKDYKDNPLRIYFEQKDGSGSDKMLPYKEYKTKMENKEFSTIKLKKFLKKVENRICNTLSNNVGGENFSNLEIDSRLPFSKGYASLSTKTIGGNSTVVGIVISESKNNLILTIHKSQNNTEKKCIICLWDTNVARIEPIKTLISIDNVTLGRYRGNTDGIFVAALEDCSMHLWDLAEEPLWSNDVVNEEILTKMAEVNSQKETGSNNSMTNKSEKNRSLQPCAYTSSAANVTDGGLLDGVVGLEFVDVQTMNQDGGRKLVGQICSLHRIGIIIIWSIVQDKRPTEDMGKAYWSKMKLVKSTTISLNDHFDVSSKEVAENENVVNFNITSAKRRLATKKQEKSTKRGVSRQKSAISSDFDINRPASTGSLKKALPVENNIVRNWENGIVCYDLKITKFNKADCYLVAKNCGEVLCCTRAAGVVKINRFCVANDTSSITKVEASPHQLPYFLAATESGTVNLCSMADSRVLLTLDCRNNPQDLKDKCRSDHKGRYVGSAAVQSATGMMPFKPEITSIHWSLSNPCAIYVTLKTAIAAWDLTYSDICAKTMSPHDFVVTAINGNCLAVLTSLGNVQVHKLTSVQSNGHFLDLFQKYVTIL